MTNLTRSPLATGKPIPTGGRYGQRNSKITGMTWHHQAGVNAMGEATNPRRQVSANYWIGNDGTIYPNIPENLRAWTTGAKGYPAGAASDHRNITVEVSNSPEGMKNGTYAISDAAAKSLIALTADVFKRHSLGKVRRGLNAGVAVHKDFVPTACPGPYIMKNLSHFIKEAEKVRSGKPVPPKPAPKPKPTPKPIPKPVLDIEWPKNALLVDGVFGPVTRRAYQTLLSWKVTGNYNGWIDGSIGPLTVRAEQRWLKKLGYSVGPIDGVRGPRTIRALQRFLRTKGLYKGLIDGSQGPMTTRALQAYLNQQRRYA